MKMVNCYCPDCRATCQVFGLFESDDGTLNLLGICTSCISPFKFPLGCLVVQQELAEGITKGDIKKICRTDDSEPTPVASEGTEFTIQDLGVLKQLGVKLE